MARRVRKKFTYRGSLVAQEEKMLLSAENAELKKRISLLIGATIMGTGWFMIRLVTTKSTGYLDWTFVLFMAQIGVYAALAVAPIWAKNPTQVLVTIGAATIIVSAPIHYQVFAGPVKWFDTFFPCLDVFVFFAEIFVLAAWIGYLWYVTLAQYPVQKPSST